MKRFGVPPAPGGRVIVFAPDSIDWVVAYLGVIWAGGVAMGVNRHQWDHLLDQVRGARGHAPRGAGRAHPAALAGDRCVRRLHGR